MFNQGALVIEVARIQRLEALQAAQNMAKQEQTVDEAAGSDSVSQDTQSEQTGGPTKVHIKRPKCHSCCTSAWCPILMTFVMIVSAILFFVLHFFVMSYLQSRVQESVIIRDREAWVYPEADMFFRCHLFNVTNSADLTSGKDSTVKVKEIGPYVYRIGVERTHVVWNANHTVSYRMHLTFNFDPEQSVGSEEDMVTTVNLPTVALHVKAGTVGSWALNGMFSLKGEMFHTFTIRKLLWGFVSEDFKKLKNKLNFLHLKLPTEFGYFVHLNNTSGEMFNVYTGEWDFSKFNEIYSWNFFRKLPFWSSSEASSIRGTDGSMFQPFLDDDTRLTVFIPGLLRSFDLQYVEDVESKGIDCRRYTIPNSEFSNRTPTAHAPVSLSQENVEAEVEGSDLSKTNSSFLQLGDIGDRILDKAERVRDRAQQIKEKVHQSDTIEDEACSPRCLPNGMYSLESVFDGVPLTMSLPHLLGADPVYSRRLHGLSPVEADHRPRFDVNEVTGVVVDQKRRYQANMRLPETESDDLGTFVPLFWVEEAITVNDATAKVIAEAHMVVFVTSGLRYFVLALSALAWILVIVIIVVRACNDADLEVEVGGYKQLTPQADPSLPPSEYSIN